MSYENMHKNFSLHSLMANNDNKRHQNVVFMKITKWHFLIHTKCTYICFAQLLSQVPLSFHQLIAIANNRLLQYFAACSLWESVHVCIQMQKCRMLENTFSILDIVFKQLIESHDINDNNEQYNSLLALTIYEFQCCN